MILANGKSKVTDNVYYDRFSHVPELNRFGANIKLKKNTAHIQGVKEIIGAPVMSTDIRASASLVIAGLAAKGKTEINRVYHIDRGYENIERKFQTNWRRHLERKELELKFTIQISDEFNNLNESNL